MLPDYHSFFSDYHIGNAEQWIKEGEDPMVIQEQTSSRTKARRYERLQLIFGAFIFVLIVISSELPHFDSTKKQAQIVNITDEEKISPALLRTDIPSPELSAESYAVRFMGSPQQVMEQRKWKQFAPASLTKILTAMVALEQLAPETNIVISKTAKTAGEKMSRVPAGEIFTRDDAIQLMLMESDNDVATALAETIEKERTGNNPEPGLPHFIKIMNEAAVRAGMKNSYFQNPTGLDQYGHFVTAEDLQNLVEYIWNIYPKIWGYTTQPTAEIISKQNHLYEAKNTDELLDELPALKGGKTGLTERAKGALILLYPVKPSHTAIIVILGSDNRFEDGKKIVRWLEEVF